MTEPANEASDRGGISLAERANQALLALADRADRKKTEAELSAITTACTRAESLTASLEFCAQLDLQLNGLGVRHVRPSAPAPAAKAIPNLRSAATRIANPDQDLTERLRSGAVQDALKAAEVTIKALEQALIHSAEAERTRLMPNDLDQPIATMPGSESLQARIGRIRTLLSQRFSGPVDALPEIIERWRKSATDWEDARKDVSQRLAELPSEIKTFVEAAASGPGAAWSLLTPAVRDWLDTGNRGEGYEVRKW